MLRCTRLSRSFRRKNLRRNSLLSRKSRYLRGRCETNDRQWISRSDRERAPTRIRRRNECTHRHGARISLIKLCKYILMLSLLLTGKLDLFRRCLYSLYRKDAKGLRSESMSLTNIQKKLSELRSGWSSHSKSEVSLRKWGDLTELDSLKQKENGYLPPLR